VFFRHGHNRDPRTTAHTDAEALLQDLDRR
jgi:hypothetical protein